MAGMDMGSEGFKNEPNVVPMIDILLVLLIIFMMQVPLQRKAMDVNLPGGTMNRLRNCSTRSDSGPRPGTRVSSSASSVRKWSSSYVGGMTSYSAFASSSNVNVRPRSISTRARTAWSCVVK